MSSILAAAVILSQQHPYQFGGTIGGPIVKVQKGTIISSSGKVVSVADIAAAADNVEFVLVGEQHATPEHHQMQADVIRALVARGRDVSVGFEMFTRDNQSKLAPFTMGKVTLDEFPEYVDWETQWGHDYNAYRPIFSVVQEFRLPMVALNLPREWVRRIGREGPSSVKEGEKAWLPEIYTGNKSHRAIFDSMMGGHPMTGPQGENIYSAQVSWDTGMAKSALDAMNQRTSKKKVMVIVAGIGHTMYGQCINYRIERLGGKKSISVACMGKDTPEEVASKIGDFIYRPAD